MKRLLRILLNAATVLSLVLCVATVVLWRVGDFDCLWMTGGHIRRHVGVRDLCLCWSATPDWPYQDLKPRRTLDHMGAIHLLPLVLLSAVLPGFWFRRRLWPRILDSLRPAVDDHRIPCRSCGYDLRATPASCPECGTVPEGVTT